MKYYSTDLVISQRGSNAKWLTFCCELFVGTFRSFTWIPLYASRTVCLSYSTFEGFWENSDSMVQRTLSHDAGTAGRHEVRSTFPTHRSEKCSLWKKHEYFNVIAFANYTKLNHFLRKEQVRNNSLNLIYKRQKSVKLIRFNEQVLLLSIRLKYIFKRSDLGFERWGLVIYLCLFKSFV